MPPAVTFTEGALSSDKYKIGSRIQRSTSAPPISENVGSAPPPMYIQNDFNDVSPSYQTYYYNNGPTPNNPRLPISYNNYENRYRSLRSRIGEMGSTPEEMANGYGGPNENPAPTASQAAFEAAVAAAGGHSVTRNHSPQSFTSDITSSSIDSSRKSLIDRIQEDFPRTPSPVYGLISEPYPPLNPQNPPLNPQHPPLNPQHPLLNSQHPPLNPQHPLLNPQLPHLNRQQKHVPPGIDLRYSDVAYNDVSNILASGINRMHVSQSDGREMRVSMDSRYQPSMYMGFHASRSNNDFYPTYEVKRRIDPAIIHGMDPRLADHRYRRIPPSYQDSSLRYRQEGQIEISPGYSTYVVSNDSRMIPMQPEIYPSDPRELPPSRDVYYESNGYNTVYYESGYFPNHQDNRSHEYQCNNNMNVEKRVEVERTRNRAQHVKDRTFKANNVHANHSHTSTTVTDNIPHSSLLEEFRNTMKTKFWEIKDIKGHVIEFTQDQHGSRFFQQKLEIANEEEKQLLFDEVYPEALRLMTDVFGNYVIQKFFDYGNQCQKNKLASCLTGKVLELSLQMYGCRVIQKALEAISMDHQIELISELKGHVMQCVKDQNGNHVIQKCIEMVKWNSCKDNKSSLDKTSMVHQLDFILSEFSGHVYMLATHPYGCRVIQRVLEHCDESKTNPILEEIQRSCYALVQDQYGNYVIQHVLERGHENDRNNLIDKIRPEIPRFSQHKFASNAVEKCLIYANKKQRGEIIDELLSEEQRNVSPLHMMMKDPYANYVVQKLIDVLDASERDLIVERIKVQAPQLRRFTYGKHILARLEKLTGQTIL